MTKDAKSAGNLTCTSRINTLQHLNKPITVHTLRVDLVLLCIFFSWHTNAQIFTEDFESGNSGYTSSTPEFTDGGSDYFTIDDGSSTSGSYGGATGSYFAAQDIDGEVPSSMQTLTWSGIDISGCSNLQFSIDVAEDDDGSNQDWDENNDYLHIEYSIDGGAFQNLMWFESTGTGFNTEPAEDTDFDGFGDGTAITDVFQTFTKSIVGSGNSLELRIIFDFDSGDEDVAIDNIEIDGNCASCSPATEPTVQASSSLVSNIDCYTVDLSWTNGNGSNALVVLSTNPVSGTPSDLTGYTGNPGYGSGDNLGSTEYIVYNGTGNNVSITGLSHSTTYYYAIFTFNVTNPNCDENYLTSISETGSFTTSTCTSACPYISSIMFNSCGGSEGLDEYWTFETGSDPINIDDIVVDYPNQQYCNTGCPDGGLLNNQPHVDALNATAGCSPDLFVYADPIPPNSSVIVFTGNPPSTVLDFSSNCAAAPVYVIFTENNSTAGRFSNSGVRDLTVDFGGSCNETVTYDGSQAGSDGGTVNYDNNGNATYSTSTACVYPLPVTLLQFEVTKKETSAFIQWTTASETNVAYYTIEHSLDGRHWSTLGTETAAGNVHTPQQYSFTHTVPPSGINYYSVSATDLNGIAYEIGTRSLAFKNDKDITVRYFQNQIQIQSNFSVKNAQLEVYTISGKPMLNQNLNQPYQNTINTPPNWAKGMYLIGVNTADGQRYTKKIVIH